MRIVLDTHFIVWMVVAPEKVSQREWAMLDSSALVLSPVSIWELRLKWDKFDRYGRRKGEIDPADALLLASSHGIELAALNAADFAVGLATPLEPTDPFDEMLLIHAQILGAKLLTRDRRLFDHPLAITAQPPKA